jgi:hypothetical protein
MSEIEAPTTENNETVEDILTQEIAEDWEEITIDTAREWAKQYIYLVNAVKAGRIGVRGVVMYGDDDREYSPAVGKLWINTLLYNQALPTVIRAQNGTGKSYLNSWAILRAKLLHPEGDFFNNVPWYWNTNHKLDSIAFPDMYKINKMSEMLIGGAKSVLADRVPFINLDEFDNAVDSQNWRDDGPQSWKSFTYIKRHLKFRGPLLSYHSWEDIPNYMRLRRVVADHYKVIIHGKNRYIFSRLSRPQSLVVTGPIIPYSKHGSNDFSIDVDAKKLRILMGETGQAKEAARRVLKYIGQCMIDTDGEEPKSRPIFKCDICGLEFLNAYNYESHINSRSHKQKAALLDKKGPPPPSKSRGHSKTFNAWEESR